MFDQLTVTHSLSITPTKQDGNARTKVNSHEETNTHLSTLYLSYLLEVPHFDCTTFSPSSQFYSS